MTNKKEATAAAERENKALEQHTNLAGAPSASERAAAQKEGITDAIKEAAADTYRYVTDGVNLSDAEPGRQWHGADEIMQFAPLLDLGQEEFEARIAEKPKDNAPPVPEEKVAGLLGLERSGRNRTGYVKAMCKRLGVKSPYEVTNAGPGYTNDETPVTRL